MREALLNLLVNIAGTIIGGVLLHWMLHSDGAPTTPPKATYAALYESGFSPSSIEQS
ncbi:hypothetical protein D9M69_468930 [compost metagenome]